jgi:hypothetical protein
MGASDVALAAATAAERRRSAALERLERLVCLDSGADAPAGRESVAGLLAEWAAGAGCAVELVPGTGAARSSRGWTAAAARGCWSASSPPYPRPA